MLTFFTPAEANSLLPDVRSILQDMLRKKNLVASRRNELDRLERMKRTKEIEATSQEIQELIAKIERGAGLLEEMGCIVRHIDEGIVDFPAMRYGRQVYLCWRMNEPEVAYWHDIGTGFAGRTRISEGEVAKAYV